MATAYEKFLATKFVISIFGIQDVFRYLDDYTIEVISTSPVTVYSLTLGNNTVTATEIEPLERKLFEWIQEECGSPLRDD